MTEQPTKRLSDQQQLEQQRQRDEAGRRALAHRAAQAATLYN
jgi:hypothetical protein